MYTAIHLPRLGQQALPESTYSIDRGFAQAIVETIELLVADEIPPEWAGEQCWIDLRIKRWAEIEGFASRLMAFLERGAQRLPLAQGDEALIGEILTCFDVLTQKESADTASTVELTATVVGGLGALVALGFAIGLV